MITSKRNYRYIPGRFSRTQDVDDLYGNPAAYDPIKVKEPRSSYQGFKAFYEAFPPFVDKVLAGVTFTNEELVKEPYYGYLTKQLNPKILGKPKGHRHVLNKMRDAIRLTYSIRDKGMMAPLDLYRYKKRRVVERGNRRLVIAKKLGWTGVPVRVFFSKQMFLKRKADFDERSRGRIEKIAIDQFCEMRWEATDKWYDHNYCHRYDDKFKQWYRKRIKILEIGVANGASLLMWKKAFPNAVVYGIDNNPKVLEAPMVKDNNFQVFIGNQSDEALLNKVAKCGPFHIVIDDGSHFPHDIIASLDVLWYHMAPRGYYVIEDGWQSYRHRSGRFRLNERLKSFVEDVSEGEVAEVSFYPNTCFIRRA